MKTIDLNCDMGESFGAWRLGRDAELMDHVSSVNIACGFHAGDPSVIRRTVDTAFDKGLAVGAHPSFPDLQGFGRREMRLSPEEILDTVLYQIAALKGFCDVFGGKLSHVKPHGALYNQAARERPVAEAFVKAVKLIDPDLCVYGLSNSHILDEAARFGLKTASEVFADRTYQPDGSLTPRSDPDALISDSRLAVKQVLQMVKEQKVKAAGGAMVSIKADTVCIHGDGDDALEFAMAIKKALEDNGIVIAPPE